jgi:hypothetical protein
VSAYRPPERAGGGEVLAERARIPKEKKMEIDVAIWNGTKARVLMVGTFNSSKEALSFLAEVQKLDEKATLSVSAIRKVGK